MDVSEQELVRWIARQLVGSCATTWGYPDIALRFAGIDSWEALWDEAVASGDELTEQAVSGTAAKSPAWESMRAIALFIAEAARSAIDCQADASDRQLAVCVKIAGVWGSASADVAATLIAAGMPAGRAVRAGQLLDAH